MTSFTIQLPAARKIETFEQAFANNGFTPLSFLEQQCHIHGYNSKEEDIIKNFDKMLSGEVEMSERIKNVVYKYLLTLKKFYKCDVSNSLFEKVWFENKTSFRDSDFPNVSNSITARKPLEKLSVLMEVCGWHEYSYARFFNFKEWEERTEEEKASILFLEKVISNEEEPSNELKAKFTKMFADVKKTYPDIKSKKKFKNKFFI